MVPTKSNEWNRLSLARVHTSGRLNPIVSRESRPSETPIDLEKWIKRSSRLRPNAMPDQRSVSASITVGAMMPTIRIEPMRIAAAGRPKFNVQRRPSRVGTKSAGSSALQYN